MTVSSLSLPPGRRPRGARCLAPFLSLLSLVIATPALALTYSVGPGATCTHDTLQEAMDAAAANPGPDTIRIVRNATWTAQQASTDTDHDLEIIGGVIACTIAEPDGRTTLSGEGGAARPVITLRGSGIFRLRNLVIRDGDQAGDDDGGGIYFRGGGVLEITNSAIQDNEAEDGGGIYAEGTTNQAELIIGQDVIIGPNRARRHGGGVLAQNIEMTMIAPGSMLFMNEAGGRGGGLLVASGNFVSYAYIGSNGFPGLGTIYGNRAAVGGGVAALAGDGSGKEAEVQIFSTDPSKPLEIRGNFASERGGALDLHPDGEAGADPNADATARLKNVAIEGNTSPVGAAVNLSYNNYGPFGESAIGGKLIFNQEPYPHPAAAACPYGVPCGYIRDNDTVNVTGAVVHLSESAYFWASRIVMQGNRGGWLIYASGEEFTWLHLDNTLVTGNNLEHALIRDDTNYSLSDWELVDLHYLTIAGNTIGANGLLSINEDMALTRTLIDQPGKALFATDVGSTGGNHDVHYLMMSQTPIPVGAFRAAPRFVDPARGDYMPRAGSSAVDYAPVLADYPSDLHSHRRDVDIPLNINATGVSDIGALEREYLQPLVLNSDFDEDTHLWTDIGGGTWDGTQDANADPASGSVRVPMPNENGGKRAKLVGGLSQCIHIPGPGNYLLNGSGRVMPASNPPLANNRVSLRWELRRDGGADGCEDGIPTTSGIHPLASTGTWTRPALPAQITVGPGQWTPNTSLTIRFDVSGSVVTPPTGWFDSITLEPGELPPPDEMFADGFE